MSRTVAWMIHLSAVLLGGTGLVYGWLRYFTDPVDEFAIYNHPAEPGLRDVHLLIAPLCLFLWGMIWRSHAWNRFRAGMKKRRTTGIALMVLLLPMVLSGYLLQVSVNETLRQVWVVTHAITGTAWILLYVLHQLGPSSKSD
ncbi:MAG: hypothetical protein OSB42_06860 [Planctomycetota bacterium]|nr:hypothetical protein [Planctomycetota bacterium]